MKTPTRRTFALLAVTLCAAAAFGDKTHDVTNTPAASDWAYRLGEGISYAERPILAAEVSLAFDSKYLSYGLVDNNDPIVTPAAAITCFDWLKLSVDAFFDITSYARRAGDDDRRWKARELHPDIWLVHSFSPDDWSFLPTRVDFSLDWQYEYHPRAQYRSRRAANGGCDGQNDTHFLCLELALSELWFEPHLFVERDLMRDSGTYIALDIGHTFDVGAAWFGLSEGTLTLKPQLGQGFGNAVRVRNYLTRETATGEERLDHAGLMDSTLRLAFTWKIGDALALGGYVQYTDFLFDRKIREAARHYEATGTHEESWNFTCGLALTASF